MTLQARIVMGLLWIVSLVVVGSIATAQTRREAVPVISGADIGFRPDGWQGKARTGTWVVKINGEWVEAVASSKVSPATTR
jgi:hypothetical protein